MSNEDANVKLLQKTGQKVKLKTFNLEQMNKIRRHYDKEFKLMAVELVLSGKSSKSVGEDLGIRTDLVNRWRREYERNKTGSFSGQGTPNLTPEEKEIARLKRALREAEMERDILKKAVSIFSKSDGRSTSL